MEKVDLKIGFACNNRCAFCVQGDKRSERGPRPFARVRLDLLEGRRAGAAKVVVTGGEPTVHHSLLETVRLAKALGYESIQVQSNGRRFFYRAFCEDLIRAGVDEFLPSLHGSCAGIHDALTRSPGSFLQAVQGIRNLKQLGQVVLVNSVITESNYRDLPALARLLVSLKVDQFQFAFVHILGSAEENKRWLVPRVSAVMPYVLEGLRAGSRAGTPCYTEAIPYCLMPGYEAFVAERVIPGTVVYDAEHVIDDYTDYRRHEGKSKGPLCGGCSRRGDCEGPWKEYPEIFGWAEFQPAACA